VAVLIGAAIGKIVSSSYGTERFVFEQRPCDREAGRPDRISIGSYGTQACRDLNRRVEVLARQ